MKSLPLLTTIALCAAVIPAMADKTHTERVQFAAGKSSATLAGKVAGADTVLYKLNAKDGQFLKVSLTTDNESADFNIYIPGRGPGDEALFASAMSTQGRAYTGQLYKTGDHSITVFLNRNAARKGETANFKLHVSVTDKQPGEPAEETPATGPVPQKVVDDCLAELRKQLGNKPMTVLTRKRGETSFIIDVKVEGVPKPWRCFHDGTKCTGTEYQGEG
jgi:hypothetical protein